MEIGRMGTTGPEAMPQVKDYLISKFPDMHEALLQLPIGEWLVVRNLTSRKRVAEIRGEIVLYYQGHDKPFPWRIKDVKYQHPGDGRIVDLWLQKIPWELTDEQSDFFAEHEDFFPAAYQGDREARRAVRLLSRGNEYGSLFGGEWNEQLKEWVGAMPIREAWDRYQSMRENS